MARNDSQERLRPLLLVVFVVVFGLLLFRFIRLWEEIDTDEKWGRAAELLLIAVGAWVVVWPESFAPWRSSKRSRGPKHCPEESRAEPSAAESRGEPGGGIMTESSDLSRAHLRVARPTDDLAAVVAFYRDGLGFEMLVEFADHEGFDGVMLGRRGAAYHLEFTRKAGHPAGRAPTADHLLVFYLPDEAEWRAAGARLERAGHRPVASFNPYWDRRGCTFEDPDGYRVVLHHGSWPADGGGTTAFPGS